MQIHFYKRIVIYIFISFVYISFMSTHAPLGTGWLDWHFNRIYNFSEFLKINGYFSNFGFSIWNKCNNCDLSIQNFEKEIYLSINAFSYLPYILINEFLGSSNLKFLGNYLDKTAIVLSGFLISELYILISRVRNIFIRSYTAITIFIFFIINPWTYKMLVASWTVIYFTLFFLLSCYFFLIKKEFSGLVFLFIAGLFDYQSSAGLLVFYCLVLLYAFYNKNTNLIVNFISLKNKKFKIKFIFSLLLPIIIYFTFRLIISYELDISSSGSSLLSRIGISGSDYHNGGILGALQFLGGNRITRCLEDIDLNLNTIDLSSKIFIFNCILSIMGMFFLSIISLIGIFFFSREENKFFNLIIFPILFLLISYTMLLQQSSSVHLMGYSYFFSFLFSLGIVKIFVKVQEKYNYSIVSLIISLPLALGIIILCIRVSMLTGVNG